MEEKINSEFNPVGPCHAQAEQGKPRQEERITISRTVPEWEGHLTIRYVDGHILVHSGCQWAIAHSFKDVEKQVSAWLETYLHPWLVKKILATQENPKDPISGR